MACVVGAFCGRGIGPERGGRAINEDNFLVASGDIIRMWSPEGEITEAQRGDGVLVAVCDGLGGHGGGDVASAQAVRALSGLHAPGVSVQPARAMLQFVRESHQHLRRGLEDSSRMGTTVVVLRLVGDRAAWVNVGDSRLYRLRSGRLVQLSRDQTRNEFHYRDGTPTSATGDNLCQAFLFGSRGLGQDTNLRLERGLDADAVPLRPGDRFLLCTDGIHSVLEASEIATVLGGATDPGQTARSLYDAALRAGSTDNATAVVVRVDGMLPLAQPIEEEPVDTIDF